MWLLVSIGSLGPVGELKRLAVGAGGKVRRDRRGRRHHRGRKRENPARGAPQEATVEASVTPWGSALQLEDP